MTKVVGLSFYLPSDPTFVDALDKHFFEYVEIHIPFYEEMKRKGNNIELDPI